MCWFHLKNMTLAGLISRLYVIPDIGSGLLPIYKSELVGGQVFSLHGRCLVIPHVNFWECM